MRIATLAIFIVACSTEVVTPVPKPTIATYGPQAKTILAPYPSDRYTRPDPSSPTGLRVHIDAMNTGDALPTTFPLATGEINQTDGFSISGGVILTFDGRLDIRGLVQDPKADPPILDPIRDANDYAKPDAPMFLLDVDPKSPERGTLHGIVPRFWAQDVDPDYSVPDYTLVAQPARPLRPKTKYVFAATNRLKDVGGRAIAASSDFQKLLAQPNDDYERGVVNALGELESRIGVKKSDVVVATVFTTQSVYESMTALQARARAQPVPKLVDPWTLAKPMQLPDKRVRFRATLDTPDYRDSKSGQWHTEKGAPTEQSRAALEVFLDCGDGTKGSKHPVAIFQHGLGGDKDGTWGTSERLSALDACVFGIDSPWHGSRAPGGTTDMIVSISLFLGIDLDKKTFDIAIARDNFRQMASDQLELVRLIDSLATLDMLPAGAPDGIPDLDVSHILYIGHSFGSVQGATVFALAPEITQAVWNVGGADLTVLIRDSPLFSLVLNGLRPAGTPYGAVARFLALAQALVDPGDPVSYARYATLEPLPGVAGWKPRDVLLQEVVNDGIVPNSSSDALARAAGLAHVDPFDPISGLKTAKAPVTANLPSGATGAIYPYKLINGGMVASHGELIFSPEARAQYVEFFRSGLANGHATVVPATR